MKSSVTISVPANFRCSTPIEIVRSLNSKQDKSSPLTRLLEDFHARTGHLLKQSDMVELVAASVSAHGISNELSEKIAGQLPDITAFLQHVVSKGELTFGDNEPPVALSSEDINIFEIPKSASQINIRKNQLLRAIHQLMIHCVDAVADILRREIPSAPPVAWDGNPQTLRSLVMSLTVPELQNAIDQLPSVEKYKIVQGMVALTKDQYRGKYAKQYWSDVFGVSIQSSIPPIALQNFPLFLRHVKKLMKISDRNDMSMEDLAAIFGNGTLIKKWKKVPTSLLAEFLYRKISMEVRIRFFKDFMASLDKKVLATKFAQRENVLRAVCAESYCPQKTLAQFFEILRK